VNIRFPHSPKIQFNWVLGWLADLGSNPPSPTPRQGDPAYTPTSSHAHRIYNDSLPCGIIRLRSFLSKLRPPSRLFEAKVWCEAWRTTHPFHFDSYTSAFVAYWLAHRRFCTSVAGSNLPLGGVRPQRDPVRLPLFLRSTLVAPCALLSCPCPQGVSTVTGIGRSPLNGPGTAPTRTQSPNDLVLPTRTRSHRTHDVDHNNTF
jgi:hypothetical protein